MLGELSGQRFRWAPLNSADVVGVGSLMQAVLRSGSSATIFGTGSRVRGAIASPKGQIVSVRGPLTADALHCPDVPLGDPALAIGALTPRSGRVTGPVIVPHFRVFGTREGIAELRRLRSAGFEVVLPNWAPLRVAKAVSQAQYVLTSSLHGLIFAHGLGCRVRLMSFDGVPPEPDFKYEDHLALFDLHLNFLDSRRVVRADRLPRGVGERMEVEQQMVAGLLPARLDGLYASGALLS